MLKLIIIGLFSIVNSLNLGLTTNLQTSIGQNQNCLNLQRATEIALKSLESNNLLKEDKKEIIVDIEFKTQNWEFEELVLKKIQFINSKNDKNSRIDVRFLNYNFHSDGITLRFKSYGSGGYKYTGEVELQCENDQLKFKKINYISAIECFSK